LEQVEAAARVASGRLDHVLRADAEDPQLALPELPPLDCLIYGDVLEHLRDPWATLRRHAALLHDEGVLLACVPNVQHWSVLANLLQGRWPLAEEGLFDRTHLRWFTRDSLRELVAGCGLQLQELTPRVFQPERAEAFVAMLEPALAGLGVDRQRLLDGVAPLQYMLRASRRPRPSLHLDCLTLRPQAGMVDVRILQPLRSLTSQPSITARAAHGTMKLLPASSRLPRLLIWQRPSLTWPDSLEQLRRLLRNGYVVVVHDRAFFDALQLPSRHFTPTCDYATYRQVMGSCHIAFLPLADTPFNRCKSDLKALEAGGHGLAILASPVVYAGSLRDGETGRLFTMDAQLEAILQGWLADPAAAQAMGQRARQWVAGSRLQQHQAPEREAWYRSLWERREKLTAQLLERVPELRL
jgi:hypothetical protein